MDNLISLVAVLSPIVLTAVAGWQVPAPVPALVLNTFRGRHS